MHYVDLMVERPLVWAMFIAYLLGTSVLAWIGHRRTKDIKSFAVGSGKMNPVVVGITLAASIASTATFVINPGFVYVHGVSALMHLGVAAALGVIVGLFSMSGGFRRIGQRTGALTLPQWMAQRYGSRGLAVLFAAVNLLSLSFVVLIVGGISIVMQQTLGLSNVESLVVIVGFVFSYVLVGGTYAHAYTNTMQGGIMVVISVLIVASGLSLFSDGPGAFLDSVAAQGPQLVEPVNPESPLFGNFFSVYVSGFVIGFALVCQPHIMTKALYVDSDRAVRKSLYVTVAVSLVFSALLLVGLYARATGLPPEAFVNPETGAFSQDRVMAVYLAQTFDPATLALVTVALLAAGMSTLDGILVALSSIIANDLVLPFAGKRFAGQSDDARARFAHRASQAALIVMGLAAFLIALDPPKLLGIFGQVGVYGIVAASAVPVLLGVLVPQAGRKAAFWTSIAGLGTHLALYGVGQVLHAGGDPRVAQLGLLNPGVTATVALLVSAAVAAPTIILAWKDKMATPPSRITQRLGGVL